MQILNRFQVRKVWQKLTAISSTYLAFLLFVIIPFFEYCIRRTTIVHYYLGDSVSNYIGLFAVIWAAASLVILLNRGLLKIIPLLLLAGAIAFYCHYFPYPELSILVALGLMCLVELDKKTTFLTNSLILFLGLLFFLYAVFGIQANRSRLPTKPINTVILVFDEFGLEQVGGYHLLEDKTRFPNFSAIMATSDIYHNAVANNSYTEKAVPAIIAGRHANLIGGGFYRGPSLFELFRRTHRMHVVELIDTFEHQFDGRFADRVGKLFKHYLGAVYRTPRIDGISDLVTIAASPDKFSTNRSRLLADELVPADQGDHRPFFYFHHLLAPHRPYQWNAAYFYNQNETADVLFRSELDENTRSLVNMTNYRERYIDQLKRIDQELGRLTDALHEKGVFDDTEIILTSDHGISFDPGKSARMLEPGNEISIQFVPLIVKHRAQVTRRDVYEPISNLAVHRLALEANGGARKGEKQPGTGRECFWLFNCVAAPELSAFVTNVADYEKRVAKQGAQFERQLLPEGRASDLTVPELPEAISDYAEIEPGFGNIDSVTDDSNYYPFNLVFSFHGTTPLGKTLYAFVDNKPCASIEIDKKSEKYSVYCSLPFPKHASQLDFYLFDGIRMTYLPKKLGYNHFLSSKWSGAWREIYNAAPSTYASPYAAHRIYLAENHREIIFVDGKTENIDQRVAFPSDFDFDAIHLYDVNFLLTSKKSGQVLVFNYRR